MAAYTFYKIKSMHSVSGGKLSGTVVFKSPAYACKQNKERARDKQTGLTGINFRKKRKKRLTSSPKDADELSEIGDDALKNKDVKGYRSIRSRNGMHGFFTWRRLFMRT